MAISIYKTPVKTVGGLTIFHYEKIENGKLVQEGFMVLDSSGEQINGAFDSAAAACEYAENIQKPRPPKGPGTSGAAPSM